MGALVGNGGAVDSVHCPVCGSGDISGGFVEVVDDEAYQPVDCLACSSSWRDVYRFIERENIDRGSGVRDVRRGFVVRLSDTSDEVTWCSDWATFTASHARGQLGSDVVGHVHHGAGTLGHVSYHVLKGAECGACVESCDVPDAVVIPYGERGRSVLFIECDVMGDARSFVPVCETCADWFDQNGTLVTGVEA